MIFTSTLWKSLCYVINLKLIDVIDVYHMFLPLSSPGWRGIVVTVGPAGGCQIWGTHISVTAWWIFTVQSSWAKSLSNLPQIGSRFCGTHISETAGWTFTIWSSMEFSRPVVVQHHGYLTLTLDFQGQILKMLYLSMLRNGRADWHGTKGMWVDRMLDSNCDCQLWPHPWPWPWIFKVNF